MTDPAVEGEGEPSTKEEEETATKDTMHHDTPAGDEHVSIVD